MASTRASMREAIKTIPLDGLTKMVLLQGDV